MTLIYANAFSTTPVGGATLVPSPLLPTSTFSQLSLLILQPNQLIQLLPTLKQLAKTPLVIQVSTSAVSNDHAQVLAVRGSGFALLYSSNEQQAIANALVAAQVANSGRGVIHFGEFEAKVDFGFAGTSVSTIAVGSEEVKSLASLASTFASVYAALPASHSATPFSYSGDASPKTLILALGNTFPLLSSLPPHSALVSLNLYRPFSSAQIREIIPASVETVVVLEQSYKKFGKWSPVFLDVVGAFAEAGEEVKTPVILSGTLGLIEDGKCAAGVIAGTLFPFLWPILRFAPISDIFDESQTLSKLVRTPSLLERSPPTPPRRSPSLLSRPRGTRPPTPTFLPRSSENVFGSPTRPPSSLPNPSPPQLRPPSTPSDTFLVPKNNERLSASKSRPPSTPPASTKRPPRS